jgi:transposase-like protein
MNQKDRNGFGATPRRKFDETYKRHAVELTLQSDRTVTAVAKELGLPPWQLYEWRKIFAPRPGEGGPAPTGPNQSWATDFMPFPGLCRVGMAAPSDEPIADAA